MEAMALLVLSARLVQVLLCSSACVLLLLIGDPSWVEYISAWILVKHSKSL